MMFTGAADDSDDQYVTIERAQLEKMLELLERAAKIISQSSAS